MPVAERGRIPEPVLDAFTTRNSEPPATNSHKVAVAHRAIGDNPTWTPPAPAPLPPAPEPAPEQPRFATKRDLNRAVREWANTRLSRKLADRGAIPSDVMGQYEREHGKPVLGDAS